MSADRQKHLWVIHQEHLGYHSAVAGVCREEEIQAAGVFSERKAKFSVAKSSDMRDRAQPGARMNDSGHFFLRCSGLSSWLEKLVLSMALGVTGQNQSRNFIFPMEELASPKRSLALDNAGFL